jgi:WD40 repeat protein
VLEGHSRDVTDLCFAGEALLVTGSRDRSVRRWLLAPKLDEQETLRGEFDGITAVSCSSTGAFAFAFADDEGAVLIVAAGADEPTPLGHAGAAVLDLAIS